MLGEFFEWWGQQLLDLLPERLRQHDQRPDATIVDAGTPGLLTLLRRRAGVEARVSQIRLDATSLDEQGTAALRATLNGRPRGEAVLLRLPAANVLERQVSLPLAAERDPERVLGYEMERLTPFATDEVFWGYAVEQRDRVRARLGLRLTIVPRAGVQGLIDMLAESGGRPGMLEAPTAGGMRAITLTHEGAQGSGGWLTERNLTWAVCALFALVLLSPFLRQSLDLADIDDQLAALKPRTEQVEALRQRILGDAAGGDALAAETRRLGDTLAAVAAVTEILPDNAYLTEFTMRERKMTLSGLAASAPKLISALSDDDRIRNPAFTAPVTRSETAHQDVFSIRADLAAP